MTEHNLPNDVDPSETQDWIDALAAVFKEEGPERAHFLIETLVDEARRSGAYLPYKATTAYVNTIRVEQEDRHPGDLALERKIGALTRWNATAMVVRATKSAPELGGHIASYASAAVLYEIGFNHFFHAASADHPGDLVYFQGHSSPGIYARAFLEGRMSEEQLDHFRQEVNVNGLSSYPHPWLMRDFWQFATVSMGLGPLMAIYQARFLRYLENRGLIDNKNRKVWCFCGDGEMDEPESLGAIGLAAREGLDNLIFVINCNLQRLDGPVRGNAKVIQEFEGTFRGAGWNAIKVIWGRHWDPLLAQDQDGLLLRRMEEAVDGDYQNYKARDGAFVREHFFGKYPELREMVAGMSDKDIWRLNRGGHDPLKVYAAYSQATKHTGQPTVILAKTIKGYGMGSAGEAQNTTHQTKKMSIDELKVFRDRFHIPVTDEEIESVPFYRPDEQSDEYKYMMAQREKLGGGFPQRREKSSVTLEVPAREAFASLYQDSGDREFSTTMAFVRMLGVLVKDKQLGKLIVPIVPDESRTFGMEGMFRQLGIYSAVGQLYKPVDSEQLMYYKEESTGQMLEEGITESGAMASWIAAATSYSSNDLPMIPFLIYYSMFGFQRFGDLAWAAGDMQARGFLMGGTAGRTTLAGEGLQHQDGHSHLLAATVPNCISYDPCFAYEVAIIVQDGLRRMFVEQELVYYYITIMNENYHHPAMPEGVEEDILKGMYLFQAAPEKSKQTIQLLGSGTILREVIAAAVILKTKYQVDADIWSVTSFNELRRDGLSIERTNRLQADKKPKQAFVTEQLAGRSGPVIAATDYMKAYADQIRAFVPQETYHVLGTDGFGRSDTRKALRYFFEVDRNYITYTALCALAEDGKFEQHDLVAARSALGIDPKKPDPVTI